MNRPGKRARVCAPTSRKYIPLAKLQKRKAMSHMNPHVHMQHSSLANKASMKSVWPGIYDQGQIGSCTANAFCGAFRFLQADQSFQPSRLYVYYKERALEYPDPSQISDSGAIVADARKWASEDGVAPESSWVYDVNNVNVAPPASCDQLALNHKIGMSFSITLDVFNTVQYCLANNMPVLYAFAVYQSFENTPSSGVMAMPNPVNINDPNDPQDPFLGGHEVCIVGYDDDNQWFEVANSWGTGWGDNGFFYVPYAFFNNSDYSYAFDVLFPGF
jgi:C1A family cysteine protease